EVVARAEPVTVSLNGTPTSFLRARHAQPQRKCRLVGAVFAPVSILVPAVFRVSWASRLTSQERRFDTASSQAQQGAKRSTAGLRGGGIASNTVAKRRDVRDQSVHPLITPLQSLPRLSVCLTGGSQLQ